jgi:hypothetical protein
MKVNDHKKTETEKTFLTLPSFTVSSLSFTSSLAAGITSAADIVWLIGAGFKGG